MLARKTVEAVDALLWKLRDEEKWTIAPDQVVRVHTVLLELLEDPDIATPADLAPWLAPIICGSPAEQRELYDRMTSLDIAPAPVGERRRQPSMQPARQTRRNLIAVACVLLVIAAGFTAYVVYAFLRIPTVPAEPPEAAENTTTTAQPVAPEPRHGTVKAPAATPADRPPTHSATSRSNQYFANAGVEQLGIALTGMLALLGTASLILWHVRRQYELTKAFEREGDVDHHYPQVGADLFLPADFRRISRLMLRRRLEPSDVIDVPHSVRATARSGGYFTAVYATRSHLPEYAALIDRATVNDQQALLYEQYVQQLRNADVSVEIYEFRRDPRICWRKGKRRDHVTFEELARIHGDHTLLLFCDAASFIDPVRHEIAYWAEPFRHAFRVVAILTSRPPSQWDEREHLVAGGNIGIFPASGDGIAAFAATLNTAESVPIEWNEALPTLPPILTYQLSRWVANARPSDVLIQQLVRDLEGALGPEGLRWLVAAAVYPGINWYVTLYLAAALRVNDAERTLLALVRLPWFRRGTMPDWLRTDLIWNMSRKEETEARAALEHLFISSMKSEAGVTSLHVVTYRDLRNAAPANSPLRDYVLARFMDGRRPRPIDMKLPTIWESIRRSLSSEGSRRDPLLPLLAAYMPFLSLWAAYGKQSAEVRWHGRNGSAMTALGVMWAAIIAIASFAFTKPVFETSGATWIGALVYAVTFLPLPALGFHRARRGERLRLPLLATFADAQSRKDVSVSVFRGSIIRRMVYYAGPTGFFLWRSSDPDLRWHARNGAMLSVVAGLIFVLVLPFSGSVVTYCLIGTYVVTALVAAEFAVRNRHLQLPLISAAIDHVPPDEDAELTMRDRWRVVAIVAAIVAVNFLAVRAGAVPEVMLSGSATAVWAGALACALVIDLARVRRLGMFLTLVTMLGGLLFESGEIAGFAAMIFFGNAIVAAGAFTREPAPRMTDPANLYAVAQLPRIINGSLSDKEVALSLSVVAVCVCFAFAGIALRLPYRTAEHEPRGPAGNGSFIAAIGGATCAVVLIAFNVSAYMRMTYGMKPPAPVGIVALTFAVIAFFSVRRFSTRLAIALSIVTLTIPVLIGMLLSGNTGASYLPDFIYGAREVILFLTLSAVIVAGMRLQRRFVTSAFIAVQLTAAVASSWSAEISPERAALISTLGATVTAVGAVLFFTLIREQERTVETGTAEEAVA
jgi:hypothetical protein